MLKALTLATVGLITGILAIPVLAGGDNHADAGCLSAPAIETILATIREVESGDLYGLPANAGGASGAYQYIDATWRAWASQAGVDTTTYPHAYLAPPDVQDAVATVNVAAILRDHPDVTAVPIAWYWPRALDHPEELDIVPYPTAGNRLTVRQYQQHWLAVYQRHLDSTAPTGTTPTNTAPAIAECDAAMPALTGDIGVWDPLESTCRHASLSIL